MQYIVSNEIHCLNSHFRSAESLSELNKIVLSFYHSSWFSYSSWSFHDLFSTCTISYFLSSLHVLPLWQSYSIYKIYNLTLVSTFQLQHLQYIDPFQLQYPFHRRFNPFQVAKKQALNWQASINQQNRNLFLLCISSFFSPSKCQEENKSGWL